MARNRSIPYGYQMVNGKIALHPQESHAVQFIFTQYLAGASLSRLAEKLTSSGARYHHDTHVWNKNMVKRILENEKYLGIGQYPRIIQAADFLSARHLKEDRNTYSPLPQNIQHIRNKIICNQCGSKMERDQKTGARPRWKCRNPDCGLIVYISDGKLADLTIQCLQQLAATPRLLNIPVPDSEIVISKDATRIQNELNLAFSRGTESIPFMRTLIFAGAAERYASLPDPTANHIMDQLKEQLTHATVNESILKTLFQTAVKAIHIVSDKDMELVLINGNILRSRRSEATS